MAQVLDKPIGENQMTEESTMTPEERTMLAKATADTLLYKEKADALERQVNKLTPQVITGNQLVQAQELRKDNTKTKADIAALVGVDHQALADLLGGVDTIIAKVTAGTYSEAQYNELKTANDSAAVELQKTDRQLAEQEAIIKQQRDKIFELEKPKESFPADTEG